MSLKERSLILGLGNAGGKEAKLFYDMAYTTIAANGSKQDNKNLGDMKDIYELRGYDGFGGHRELAMECLANNMEFVTAMQSTTKDIIFPIAAAGGTTGNSLMEVCCELLLETENKIICPVILMPGLSEPIDKHKNAYILIKKLSEMEGLGTCFFINNDADKSNDFKWINQTFASMLNAFLTDDSSGDINNFDTSERIEILRESGSTILTLVGNDKQDRIIDNLKNGIFCPVQDDKVCGKIGIINSNKVGVDKDSLIAEFGKPSNIFEGWNGKNTLVVIGGCNFPIDHINKLAELAQHGLEERKRNKEASNTKLIDFDFTEDKPVINKETVKKPSKLELLQRLSHGA